MTPSIDDSPRLRTLPTALSVVAGSADVLSFLGLGGLFVAHITGNLVLLAAHVVTGAGVGLAPVLAVPAFILVLAASRVLVALLEAHGVATLRPLLAVQLGLLGACLVAFAADDWRVAPGGTAGVAIGMVAVAALAVQTALVQTSLRDCPTTAVMTTNITRFTMDLGQILFGGEEGAVAAARRRAAATWPPIVGFAVGAASAAGFFAVAGLCAFSLPTACAAVALVLGWDGSANAARGSRSRRAAASLRPSSQ